jgi:hypothetical protein
MIPRSYYIFPTVTSLPRVGYEVVTIGPTQSFGHFNWDGYPALQKTFEAISGVQSLGSLMHPAPSIAESAEITAALQKAGVVSTDSMISLVEKIQKQFGGFQIHL